MSWQSWFIYPGRELCNQERSKHYKTHRVMVSQNWTDNQDPSHSWKEKQLEWSRDKRLCPPLFQDLTTCLWQRGKCHQHWGDIPGLSFTHSGCCSRERHMMSKSKTCWCNIRKLKNKTTSALILLIVWLSGRIQKGHKRLPHEDYQFHTEAWLTQGQEVG